MKYYRVYTNFNDFIPIDTTEIEKAMYAFITGSPVAFNDGATTRIDRIVPDFHRAMGWNPAHKLDADDWTDIASKGVQQDYTRALGVVRERVTFLMEHNRIAEIGKNVYIPELEATANPQLAERTKALTDKFKS